ncbi:MAG: NAD(P)H-binding protein [Pirellulales bacterium]
MLASPSAAASDLDAVRRRVLLTGATGYIGGRLIPRLEARPEIALRCLARDPARLSPLCKSTTEVAQGDVVDTMSLYRVLEGVHTAYYLVHSMTSHPDFEKQDRLAAQIFGQAARRSNVQRIIYLGGLGDDRQVLSPHLRSRQEVGRVLRDSGVECIEFRAAVVIGQGSLSFELVRSLTNRLPVMICPRWLATPTQPIAVDDMLAYLLAALDLPPGDSRVFEVGGRDVLTYGDVIREYARQRGLRRLLISVPVLTPYLSSLWLGLVTPTSAAIGRHLIEGLRNPTIVRDPAALDAFALRPVGIREAIERALQAPSTSVAAHRAV